MNIINGLLRMEKGAVMVDENHGVVRLWTLFDPFRDGRTRRALEVYFPQMEVRGPIIRLGGFYSLELAEQQLTYAREISTSLSIRKLYRFNVPESIATLRHN
jgi:hypothetical protein